MMLEILSYVTAMIMGAILHDVWQSWRLNRMLQRMKQDQIERNRDHG
jgi:uncharacterized membrane protein YedE/YeeE